MGFPSSEVAAGAEELGFLTNLFMIPKLHFGVHSGEKHNKTLPLAFMKS